MVYVREITGEKRKALSAEKKREAEERNKKLHQEESRLVKGVFKNLEAPGGRLEFAFKAFPQDPIRIYEFEDGQSYEVPLCVAKHINNTCNEKAHRWLTDSEGRKTIDVARSRQRYQFLSTEFM